jgi:aminoglycoside N3'-acetyltransferase
MISSDMGTIPARILDRKERIRGIHPMNSFTAIGPLAEKMIEKQTHLNVYGPLKMMYETAESYLGLIGVDLKSATAIHYAEEKAGRKLFRQWALEKDGTHREIAVGSCSDGFNVFDPNVKEIERSLKVGNSKWRLFPFQEFIDVITDAIVKHPEITHCSNVDCVRCNDAVEGGPLL